MMPGVAAALGRSQKLLPSMQSHDSISRGWRPVGNGIVIEVCGNASIALEGIQHVLRVHR
jgi:hypothetical protein